ncbi:MAG: FtsH protease activity modulator HflK [Eubacteriales bacterium]|jgi:membrane protease subunit HflK|nr:FtsH protease activity modulator HflK [Eubacteriales bacterium]MDD4716840.1 FtsH protease activity modulator HflK [Eubacteriales bacterium]
MESGVKIKPGSIVVIAVIAIIAILFGSNIYFLKSNEQAVITLFGKHVRTEREPGMKFKLPLVEKKELVDTEGIRRLEFGYRGNTDGSYSDVMVEAQMLTADENLVIADWAVMYKVVDSYKWLFNVDSPEKTIRTITEAAYRRVVASHSLDDILTNQKDSIQIEIRESLQGICDKYDFGIQITAVQLQDALPPDPVKDAFLEVASAREDKNAKINEATKYENEKLPIARGEAEQILNLAEGYKQQRINEAEGDTSRFLAIQKEYAANTEVTKTRLYLEMIKAVLPQVKEVYIMSDDGDVLKFLPISDGNRQGAE